MNLKRIQIFLAVFILGSLAVFTFFSRPNITGFASKEVITQEMKASFSKDQSYKLTVESEIFLDSVWVSGKVIGEGYVDMFLRTDEGRILIFSNRNVKKIPSITGFFVDNMVDPEEIQYETKDVYETDSGDHLKILLEAEEDVSENEELTGEEKVESFKMACVDTCVLKGVHGSEFSIEFNVEEGVTLVVDKIIYGITTMD